MIPRLQPNMRVCLVYANLGARLAWPVAPAVRAFINRADHELFYFWKPSNKRTIFDTKNVTPLFLPTLRKWGRNLLISSVKVSFCMSKCKTFY